ncbi:DUF3106 domain-containing protein [Arenimonas oryziterrae]|uniref:DUF3106 domain-containing protein n=1 Tax=Arenimonas oryziterrae TaxID=498055 RepID=UPI00068BCFA6|nr:DUF3106 domain-containing protein [Arenimonas oryziterrae]
MSRAWWLAGACVLISGVAVAVADVADFARLPAPEQTVLANARSYWPGLDATTRQTLQANARDWLARTPADREAVRARMQRWDALPAAERARRRAPFVAWTQLAEDERRQVRGLAAEFAALSPEQQQLLRDTYARQLPESQRAWSLGPVLGAQLAPLASLLVAVPEADRPVLLTLLRTLDAEARADLAALLPGLDAAGRDRLRRSLLAMPAEKRADWLRRQRQP